MPSPRNGGVPAQPTRGATPPPRDASVAVQKSLPLRLSGSHAFRRHCLPLSACSSGANFNGSRPGRARSLRRTLPWGLIPLTPLHHRLCIMYARVSVQPVQPCPLDLPGLRCIPRRLAAHSLLHVLKRTPPRNVSPQASDFKSGGADVPRNRPPDSIAQLGRSIAHPMYLAVRASCDPLSPAGDPPPAATGCY